MARIFNLVADWAGSGKYRAVMPSIDLAELGHETMCSDDIGVLDLDGEVYGAKADVWIGHRIERTGASELFQVLASEPHDGMLVLDIDDNIWNIHPTNPAYGTQQPHLLSANANVADLVTVCSHGLAEIVVANAPSAHVVVVPNCVPDDILDLPRTPRGERVKLGYGGSVSHAIDMPILHDVFPRLGRDFSVTLLGHPHHLQIDPLRIEYRQWSNNLTRYYGNIDFDIGLAPLADDPFNWGKSDLKVLEYMARGIPWVASRIGPYSEPDIEGLDGKAGFLVDTIDEWVDAVHALIDEPDQAASMGQAGRAWVTEHRLGSVGALRREELFGLTELRGPDGSGLYDVVRRT